MSHMLKVIITTSRDVLSLRTFGVFLKVPVPVNKENLSFLLFFLVKNFLALLIVEKSLKK